jgi:ABC-type methionine transport system ATPase subunit
MSPEVGIRVKLSFPESLVRQPVVARLVKDFDVIPDIRRADITDSAGWIVCELDGDPSRIEAAINWLRDEGIGVDLLGDVLES